jgi:ATP-dependent protease HslVU (ClpYQ) peptidase subunit
VTCVVGVVHKGQVYVGGDCAGSNGWQLVLRRDAKVFRNGAYVIGFTTSFRMGQVLRHAFKPPPPPRRRSALERFMAVDFVDALRATLKEAGWAHQENGAERGGCFLVGVSGRLFAVEDDYQVGEARDSFAAVGGGADVARGALFATQGQKPVARVRLALRAAERFNNGVRGPFLVVGG